jgi:hypothetical protein
MSVVLFLSGTTMGDALGGSGRLLRPTFEELGHEFVEVNFAKPDALALLNRTITSKSIEFAFSHVGIGVDLAGETRDKREINLWTGTGIPFISLFGDSPAYYFDRHIMPGQGFACLYAFPEHYQFRNKLPQRKGLIGVTPLRMIDETSKRDIDFRAKESGKLLFLKNGNDPKRLTDAWRDGLPSGIFVMLTDLASDLANEMHTDKGCNIDVEVCAYFQSKGLDVEASTSLRLFFVAQLDDYLRRLKSTSMAEVLNNFPVEIHGYNWEHVDSSGKRATFVHRADYSESQQLITNSLGILDMSPNTSLGPHDRPLRAYGLYTLCLTNEQEFFKRNFEQHRSFTFSFDRESRETKVAEVLAHPKRFIELGIEVADTFRTKFDPGTFGRTMLDISNCLRLAIGQRPPSLQDFFVWPPTKLI